MNAIAQGWSKPPSSWTWNGLPDAVAVAGAVLLPVTTPSPLPLQAASRRIGRVQAKDRMGTTPIVL
jgi:hypothetical protein